MIVQRKWTIARSAVGTSQPDPLKGAANVEHVAPDGSSTESTPRKTERLRAILQSWLTVDDLDSPDTTVTTVSAPHSGFIAAISTARSERPRLLVGRANKVSTDADAQIDACLLACGDEIPIDEADSEHAVHAIEDWYAREGASAAAGVGASSAVRRRQITRRIDSAMQSAPPHLRSARSLIASRARRVATTQQCADVERELDSLVHSDLPEEEWLKAIAALDLTPTAHRRVDSPVGTMRVHALMLMRGV